MACITPPALGDDQLLLYIDGEADRLVQAHVSDCTDCRQRAKALAKFQRRLSAELFRLPCPSPQELGEYHLQLIDTSRRKEIRSHLAHCPHCTTELDQLQAYFKELAPDITSSPIERLKVRIAQLIETGIGIGDGMPAPALAGVRGSEEGPRVYQVDDIQVSLNVQADPHHPGRRIVLGLVLGLELRGNMVKLFSGDQLITSSTLDDIGNFVLSNLTTGTYDLIIQDADPAIKIEDLEI